MASCSGLWCRRLARQPSGRAGKLGGGRSGAPLARQQTADPEAHTLVLYSGAARCPAEVRLSGAGIPIVVARKKAQREFSVTRCPHRGRSSRSRRGSRSVCPGGSGLRLRPRGAQPVQNAYLLATAYAGVGNRARVLAALEKAAEDREPGILDVAVDPVFAEYWSHPRVQAVIRRLGLGR
jgi:hypothetical protein